MNNYERDRDLRDYFFVVAAAYSKTRELSPLVSSHPDPDHTPTRLGPDAIHFICDVELASRKALSNNAELFEQWKRLVSGENTPNAYSIIRRCARLYRDRRLAPVSYFRHVKKGRADRRLLATTAQGGSA